MGIPFGRYQLIRKLAAGGMGQVLLAKKGQDDFEKLVVIKRILPHLVEDEEFFNMFKDEAKITMRLDHPNIARINEFGVEAGIHYIEMEYVAGEDLRRIEKRAAQLGTGIPIGVVLRVIADAAAGLDFAHKARDQKGEPLALVHRDVSPQNVLVAFDGSVKLIDFGVAKAAGRAQHTATGILKGKFPYMSPEQAIGEEIDARSDIFALGIILWEQLTGKRLFKAENDMATQRLVINCQVPLPSSVEKSSPVDLDPIVMKALAKNPADRYPDAASMRMALEDFALSHGIAASNAHLAAFMKNLYQERIAREADPRALEEDSGLTDLDAGGLRLNAQQQGNTVADRGSSASRSALGTFAGAPPKGSPAYGAVVAIGVCAIIGIAVAAFWPKKPEVTVLPPPVTTVRPAVVKPPPDEPPPPLKLHIASEPSNASLELGGLPVGTTPHDASIERAKLPLAVKVSADGYEPQQLMVTTESSSTLTVTLKRKPAAVKVTAPKNPDIKTTR
jgi:eukaryotic-like serine/threonine-protein kinase